MCERIRSANRRNLVLIGALLAGACLASRAEASPVFSMTIGQIIPGTPLADPGPYSSEGFQNIVGGSSAFTEQTYYAGTGWQPVPDGTYEAVVNSGGSPSQFVAPLTGDLATYAMAVNSQGHMVGNSTTSVQNDWMSVWQNSPGTDHAIFYSTATGTVALQTLNGTAGLPMSVNSVNQIVGESYTAQGAIHGFITMPGGAAYDLNSLIAQGSGYTILAGTRISDQGQIQAIALAPNGLDYIAFLTPNVPIDTLFGGTSSSPTSPTSGGSPVSLAPVPEPSTVYLVGLVAAYGTAKRWRAGLHG